MLDSEGDDPLSSKELKVAKLLLSLTVFLAYSGTMGFVLYKVRFKLDCQAYFTIIGFAVSIGIHLITAIINFFLD